MKKHLIRIVILAALLMFIAWIVYFGNDQNVNLYIKEIEAGYRGVIIDKYQDRTTNLIIKTDSAKEMKVGMLCVQLTDSASVGDIIEKVPNENYVYLVKGQRRIQLPYLYIHERVRSSDSWPTEWKDKWKDSTY